MLKDKLILTDCRKNYIEKKMPYLNLEVEGWVKNPDTRINDAKQERKMNKEALV